MSPWGKCKHLSVADLHRQILDAHPLGPIFFICKQISGKLGRIIGWHPLHFEVDALGNPGSTTASENKWASHALGHRSKWTSLSRRGGGASEQVWTGQLTDMTENITFPQTTCAGGNNHVIALFIDFSLDHLTIYNEGTL